MRPLREAEERARLVRLQELGRALLTAESTEAVAEAGVRQIREILACTHLSVVVFDEVADQATVMAAYSAGRTKGAGGSRWRLDAFGDPGEFRARGAILFDDLERHRELPPALAALGREGIRSVLGVPLVSGGQLMGALFAGAPTPHAFAPADAQALREAGEVLTLAIKRARRVEGLLGHAVALEHRVADLERAGSEHRELLTQIALAQEQERQRIAVDIHDDSVQVMTSAAMRLHALKSAIEDERLGEIVDQLENTVRLAVKRLRHLMFELIPPSLDRDGLGAALSIYLGRMRDEAGLAYRLEARMRTQPSAEARAILYRIAQEAVTNVVKHAGARSVVVVLDEREGGFAVQVADDGVGFSMDDVQGRLPMHLGLTAMRQRAEMAGGWCRIRSVPRSGTTVEAWVPSERRVALPESEVTQTSADPESRIQQQA
jgi:signal transduction histidine kinase